MRTLIFIFLFIYSGLNSQEALSPRIANYDISLSLDTEEKKINANQILHWKNTSDQAVDKLYFHLYYNAFKNTESTFFNFRGLPSFLSNEDEASCPWAWSRVSSIIDSQGNQLAEQMKFVSLDDGNEKDETVLEVQLITPVAPGETHSFDMNWEAKIPNIMPRTGYNKDFYFFAQWFPKLGVYETKGTRYAEQNQWNCHQYHSMGEYYSDFGVYDLKINVPENYIIGASGELIGKEIKDDRATWHYRAEDVIDFAWAASPHFIVKEDKWNDVKLKLYVYPNHVNCTDRFFETIKFTLEYLDEYVGEYPYKTLSIIDPPIHGMFTGGMEYPTLITSLSFCFLPTGFKSTETLTVHEFIHQYFMQMVATHEQEEPWLDEGITTYYEGRILDELFEKNNSFVNIGPLQIGSSEFNRGEFLSSEAVKLAPNTFKSREFIHGGYGEISYNKTAIWLKTLEGLIGRDCFDQAMQHYFNKWKFKHPNGDDFEEAINEIVTQVHGEKFGKNLDWYFDQVLRGTETCDYELYNIKNEDKPVQKGFYNNLVKCEVHDAPEGEYVSSVTLRRNGEMKLPIDLLVKFDDGSEKLEHWDGMARAKAFKYEGSKKIISAEIDPKRKIYLDTNFINNSKSAKQSANTNSYWYQFLKATQNIFQSMTIFI